MDSDEVEPATDGARWWVLPLRLSVSVGLLVLVFWRLGDDVHWTHLLPEWSVESAGWLAGAAALMLVSYALSTVRWQQVVRALELRDRFRRLLSHFLAGQFVSNALPGTIGGDVVRVARLAKDTDDTPGSFASVVLERLTGWIVLPTITFLGLAINPTLRDLGSRTALTVAVAVGTLAALVAVLVAVDHDRLFGRFADGDGWTRFVGAVHLGLGRLRRHPAAALSVLGAGFVYQIVLVLSAFMAAKALDIDVGVTALMVFLPVVLIAQVLPVSISGLGVREYLLVYLFGAVGVADEQAIGLGLLIWVLTVLTSLAGAPAFAIGGGRAGLAEEAIA